MKFLFLATLFGAAMFVGCSHKTDSKRFPATADDVASSEKLPCGLSGSVEERISDCSGQESSSKGEFILVTRTKEFKEIHKDRRSGLLWGDRLPSDMSHSNSKKACNSSLSEVIYIIGTAWRLPTKEDYKEAELDGIRKALPNMRYYFWLTDDSGNLGRWLFSGHNGSIANDLSRYNTYSVRCVAPSP